MPNYPLQRTRRKRRAAEGGVRRECAGGRDLATDTWYNEVLNRIAVEGGVECLG